MSQESNAGGVGSTPSQQSGGAYTTYQTVADTVGMVPSLNARDNLYQGAFVGICSLMAFAVGFVKGGSELALIYLLGAVILSGLLSGVVLMVVGLVRAATRKRGGPRGRRQSP